MKTRIDLHDELLSFSENVYYQPPAGYKMKYPCIIYRKTRRSRQYADDGIYLKRQEYNLMVIDYNTDSDTSEDIEDHFQYCTIEQYYTTDNLHHTTLKLYY